jgi:hypothetical protein
MIAETNIRVTFVTTKASKANLERIAQREKRTLSSQIDYIVETWLKEQAAKDPIKISASTVYPITGTGVD